MDIFIINGNIFKIFKDRVTIELNPPDLVGTYSEGILDGPCKKHGKHYKNKSKAEVNLNKDKKTSTSRQLCKMATDMILDKCRRSGRQISWMKNLRRRAKRFFSNL